MIGRVTTLLVLLTGCAPTSLAPSILRYQPINPDEPESSIGVRSGPRLAQSLSATINPDLGTPLPPELGVSVEYLRTVPVAGHLAAHFGVQAELMYALPAPGIGGMAGLSFLHQIGHFTIAPAIAARAATDFGFTVATASGSYVGGDVSVTLAVAEGDTARIGLAPFAAVWGSFRPEGNAVVWFFGAMVFARFRSFELLVGLGRVVTADAAWNVPLLGLRSGN